MKTLHGSISQSRTAIQRMQETAKGGSMHVEINRGNTYKNSGAVVSKAKSRMIKKSYMSIEKYATQGVQADFSAKKAITIANSTANMNSEASGQRHY